MTDKATSKTKLPTNLLGKGGPIVSQLALGTMTFGGETDEAGAKEQLDYYVQRGGNFIDTADVYNVGRSEEIIGRWGQARGGMDDLIIATKGRFSPAPGSHGASRRTLFRSVEGSLKRLQLEAIDLYYIHGWDDKTDIADTLGAFRDLMAAGKIHNIGWSNVTGWQLERIVSVARTNGLPMPVVLQPQYNLLDRGIELEVLPCSLEAGVPLAAWSPLGGGWLTGKYAANSAPKGATRLGEDATRGVEAYDLRNNEKTFAVLDVLKSVAEKHGRSQSQVALAWLASRPGVATILLGARTKEQLADNLDSSDLVLDQDDLDRLTRVSAFDSMPYPYNVIEGYCGKSIWRKLETHTGQSLARSDDN